MEKPQEQIVYENICMDLCLGDFRGYPPQSVGNIVHWLRALGLRDYDRTQIGFRNDVGTVNLWGKTIATYRFVDDMPVFTFNNEYEWLQRQQQMYLSGRGKYENPYEKYSKPRHHV